MLNISGTDSCPHACMLSHFSHVSLFATLWIIAFQAPLSIEFSRQEYWSGLPYSPPGNLPNPGLEPEFPVIPALQVDFFLLSHWGSPIAAYPVSVFFLFFFFLNSLLFFFFNRKLFKGLVIWNSCELLIKDSEIQWSTLTVQIQYFGKIQ